MKALNITLTVLRLGGSRIRPVGDLTDPAEDLRLGQQAAQFVALSGHQSRKRTTAIDSGPMIIMAAHTTQTKPLKGKEHHTCNIPFIPAQASGAPHRARCALRSMAPASSSSARARPSPAPAACSKSAEGRSRMHCGNTSAPSLQSTRSRHAGCPPTRRLTQEPPRKKRTNMESITLYFRQGLSDKMYQAASSPRAADIPSRSRMAGAAPP